MREAGRRRTSRRRTIIRAVLGLAIAAVAFYAVDGKRDELLGARQALQHLRWLWVGAALAAEAGSLLTFAFLQGRLLAGGEVEVPSPTLVGITLAGTAMQNSLPGGGAWATVYAFRQFRTRGADDVLAAWVPLAVAVLMATGLALLSGVGALLAGGDAASFGLTGVIALVVLLALAAFIGVRRRGTFAEAAVDAGAWMLRFSDRRLRSGRSAADSRARSEAAWQRLTAVTPGWRAWWRALGLASLVWMADCGCLTLSFFAVHAPVPWRGLLLAYGAGQLAANLPLTPGGLGVVEGSLTVALVAYGGGRVSTAVAVLLYRIFSFWLLLPVGWAAWSLIALAQRRRVPVAPASS